MTEIILKYYYNYNKVRTVVLTYLKYTNIAKKALKIHIRAIDRKVTDIMRRVLENVH